MVYSGTSENKMDDWGYPHFRTPNFFCFQVKTGEILESPTPHCRFLFNVTTMSAYISGHSEHLSPQNHLVSDWRGFTIQPGVVGSL